jgi:hypothetical protein
METDINTPKEYVKILDGREVKNLYEELAALTLKVATDGDRA